MVIGPGFNPCSVRYPLFFPLRCRVLWGLVTPSPLIQTRSFDHAMVIGPAFNPCSVRYPFSFPLRCRVFVGTRAPTPLLRIKIVRLTMRWRSALRLTLAPSGTPSIFPYVAAFMWGLVTLPHISESHSIV